MVNGVVDVDSASSYDKLCYRLCASVNEKLLILSSKRKSWTEMEGMLLEDSNPWSAILLNLFKLEELYDNPNTIYVLEQT